MKKKAIMIFSKNPSKAWGEKFYLIYTVVWMSLMGLQIALDLQPGRYGLVLIAGVIVLPSLLYPLLFHKEPGKIWDTYWFKAYVYIAILMFFQAYFLHAYFFDVLGMYYIYPEDTFHFEAALVGITHTKVPLIMYLYTQCYYLTYHVTANIVVRMLSSAGAVMKKLKPLWLALVSIFWAFMETFVMTKVAGATFGYLDVGRMMRYGTFIYTICFLTSFPVFCQIDETQEKKWSVGKVAVYALAVNAVTLIGFDLAARIIGHI